MKNKQTNTVAVVFAVIAIAATVILLGWLLLRDRADPVDTEPVSITISDVGFQTPESVLYDASNDRYLVSNINGAPLEEDGNGFISHVSIEGEVEELKWINGEDEGVTLNAPKGMAIAGDNLYVSDINVVRVFNVNTGEPVQNIVIEGASFLNDVVAASNGTVYVSDSGLDASFSSTGTDAVYAITNGEASPLVMSTELSAPNGLVIDGDRLLMVTFSSNEIITIDRADGSFEVVTSLPGGSLDGIVRLDDGTLFVSSWETESIYRVDSEGATSTAFDSMPSPADIGYDTMRHRLLIPLFNDDAVEIRSVEQ